MLGFPSNRKFILNLAIVAIALVFSITSNGVVYGDTWAYTYSRPAAVLPYLTGPVFATADDGGYLIAPGNFLIKINQSGNVEWSRFYFITENIVSIERTNSGGYVAVSGSHIVEIDRNGNMLKERVLQDFNASRIKPTPDGAFVIIGNDRSASDIGFWAAKLDADFNFEWQNTYNLANRKDGVNSIDVLPDGYILVGNTYEGSYPDPNEIWMLRLDVTGMIVWQSKYSGTEGAVAQSVRATSDGGFIVGGFLASTTQQIKKSY